MAGLLACLLVAVVAAGLLGYGEHMPRRKSQWLKRCVLQCLLGRFDAALETLNNARENDQAIEEWAILRAMCLAELGDPDNAAASYDEWLEHRKREGSHTKRAVAYVIFHLLRRPDEAISRSIEYNATLPPRRLSKDDPHREILVRFVLGKATGPELLESVVSHSDRQRTRFLLALERLGKGDREGSRAHLESIKVFPTSHDYGQLGFLLRERLRDPGWPPWIPVEDPAGASRK